MEQIPATDSATIKKIFEAQRINQYKVAESSARERIQKLRRLHDTVLKYRSEIKDALYKDYRRPAAEVDLVEIYPITSEIKHTIRHLRRWMAPEKVATPLALFGSSSWVQYEPKGVCLIIGPWNYPIMLLLVPLASAIAAGNTAIIKPSELTPHGSALVSKIVREVFDEQEVAVFEGGIDTSTALLELPFNHIFFTGSPEVGKIVMAAAAKNLASVTLELGGKSPTIIDETADISTASAQLVWTKFNNSGQACVSPDYVLVHESKVNDFVKSAKQRIVEYYGTNAAESDSYMRIINVRNFQRVNAYLQGAISDGATVMHGGNTNEPDKFIEPTIISDVPKESLLMQKEIFGPIMPIIPFRDLQDAIDLIRSKETPLGLYIYSKNKKAVRQILKATRAGGTCINNATVHFFNPNLPFGGSNYSGIGKTHGKFGFVGFCNERAVYKQIWPSVLDKLLPPYTAGKMKMIDFTIKWF